MLRAIIYGIDQFLQCPSIEGRERIWSRYGGLFQNCVAVMDASEHPIRIVKSKELEISTYPDYYYLHLNVKKLAIPMKIVIFLLIVFKCHHKPLQLLLILLLLPLYFQHQLALHRLRDPMYTGQAFFTQSIPDCGQYLHSQCKDMHLSAKKSRDVEWDSTVFAKWFYFFFRRFFHRFIHWKFHG